jgi:predicted anti-sigma-YlaC factor YlaD
MDCAHVREALSARLDGEDPGVDESRLDQHVTGCSGCTAWAEDLGALHRLVRVQPAEPVPDLSAAIMARSPLPPEAPAPGPPRSLADGAAPWWAPFSERISTVRWALFALALTQLVLAGPALLLGEDAGASVHAARELGAFDVALAVGLLVAAWQPARAWGLLPVASALAVVMAITAIGDVIDGSATTLGEVHHLLELASLVLLWLVAREARAPLGPARADRLRAA